MSRWSGLVAAGVLGLLVALMIGRAYTTRSVTASGIPEEGKPLPNFSLPLLDGGEVSGTQLRGKPLFLNFWATWCPPCRREMPEIQSLYNKLGRDIYFLLINQADPPQAVKAYLEQNGLQMPVALDIDGQLSENWGINFLPTSIFVDAKGHVCRLHVGQITKDTMMEALNQAQQGC